MENCVQIINRIDEYIELCTKNGVNSYNEKTSLQLLFSKRKRRKLAGKKSNKQLNSVGVELTTKIRNDNDKNGDEGSSDDNDAQRSGDDDKSSSDDDHAQRSGNDNDDESSGADDHAQRSGDENDSERMTYMPVSKRLTRTEMIKNIDEMFPTYVDNHQNDDRLHSKAFISSTKKRNEITINEQSSDSNEEIYQPSINSTTKRKQERNKSRDRNAPQPTPNGGNQDLLFKKRRTITTDEESSDNDEEIHEAAKTLPTAETSSLHELTTSQFPQKSTENMFSGINTAENQEGTANKAKICDTSAYNNQNLSFQVSGNS